MTIEEFTGPCFAFSNITMQSPQQPVLRIAICGGGIGGLSLAVFLSRNPNVDVKVYEATGQFKEIGAGVMIWSRTWRILEIMGLSDKFSKIAHAPPTGKLDVGFDYRRSDQPTEGFRFKLVEMPCTPCIRFHRAEFLEIFVKNLPKGVANFGKRLNSYARQHSTGPIKLHFTDGSTGECDILVGADGIKSTVREQMYHEIASSTGDDSFLKFIHPVWTGITAYRGLIKVGDIPRGKDGSPHPTIERPMMYCGKDKHVVSYSISQGDIVNVVTFASEPENHGKPFNGEWVTMCKKQELLDCYAEWEPECTQLLDLIETPSKWAIHHLQPLPFYHQTGVVLLGDAAHAMAPHQGAGAGQAIEDAFLLAGLLATHSRSIPHKLLDAYDAVRRPAANHVLDGSYKSGLMYEFNSKYGDDYQTLGEAIPRQWHWIDSTTVEEDLERARKYV
ncbi:FAD/NAD(P)-binding domain-containing protein [Panaeolus papilionaceus]|nr:FAD/NAD(P)-binding domain-containing protein [Panaeolus papilionaceus]